MPALTCWQCSSHMTRCHMDLDYPAAHNMVLYRLAPQNGSRVWIPESGQAKQWCDEPLEPNQHTSLLLENGQSRRMLGSGVLVGKRHWKPQSLGQRSRLWTPENLHTGWSWRHAAVAGQCLPHPVWCMGAMPWRCRRACTFMVDSADLAAHPACR